MLLWFTCFFHFFFKISHLFPKLLVFPSFTKILMQKSYSDHEKTVITPVQLSTKTGADSFMVYLFFSLLFQNFTFISQVTRISKFQILMQKSRRKHSEIYQIEIGTRSQEVWPSQYQSTRQVSCTVQQLSLTRTTQVPTSQELQLHISNIFQ